VEVRQSTLALPEDEQLSFTERKLREIVGLGSMEQRMRKPPAIQAPNCAYSSGDVQLTPSGKWVIITENKPVVVTGRSTWEMPD
jgi:hypothetical protein